VTHFHGQNCTRGTNAETLTKYGIGRWIILLEIWNGLMYTQIDSYCFNSLKPNKKYHASDSSITIVPGIPSHPALCP
jgi:hypothetical protein